MILACAYVLQRFPQFTSAFVQNDEMSFLSPSSSSSFISPSSAAFYASSPSFSGQSYSSSSTSNSNSATYETRLQKIISLISGFCAVRFNFHLAGRSYADDEHTV